MEVVFVFKKITEILAPAFLLFLEGFALIVIVDVSE